MYNGVRPHSSLNNLTPAEYARRISTTTRSKPSSRNRWSEETRQVSPQVRGIARCKMKPGNAIFDNFRHGAQAGGDNGEGVKERFGECHGEAFVPFGRKNEEGSTFHFSGHLVRRFSAMASS